MNVTCTAIINFNWIFSIRVCALVITNFGHCPELIPQRVLSKISRIYSHSIAEKVYFDYVVWTFYIDPERVPIICLLPRKPRYRRDLDLNILI